MFDVDSYASEDAAIAPCVNHLKHELGLRGIKCGKDGFDVLDLHSVANLFRVELPGDPSCTFSGNTDIGIAGKWHWPPRGRWGSRCTAVLDAVLGMVPACCPLVV